MHSLYRRHVQHAMAKCPKCHTRVTYIRFIGKHDLEDGDIANDGGGDGRNKEEDGSNEEESDADPDVNVSNVKIF